MTEAASVEFVGVDAAMADLRKWADQVAPAVAKAAEPFGRRIADQVSGRVPVLSGQLASSVDATVDDEGVEISMGAGLAYAGWIEYGGSRGRPFVLEGRYLYPTALAAEDDWITVASDAATELAERFSWSQASA